MTQSEMWQATDYVRESYEWRAHHKRYERFVESLPRKLYCQDCGGAGSEVVPILDDGTGPREYCGWCEGTGLVTPHLRGQWLRWKRQEKIA